MISTVRQLVEKSWEHKSKAFLTFVDLKKAYDSVPRMALWKALRKLGVPVEIVYLIRSFHQGMEAIICLNGTALDEIQVERMVLGRDVAWNQYHSCQLSRNLRDSPGFFTCVPEGSRKSALAQIVPE